ncbi:MAG: hypothetical protein APG12_00215 [Candidatus Methanofastidiosum methylothiophilum]|uniref:DUF2124 domain-containing protein n=1 Tax=Candidatus Methanofastidiosum methylothiophilum TaxID=1705564 RepID=A0A150IN38_9EURY|nr:MAG: hypothetical protein APG10_00162 [Candidatus Methanofastidiosum methylthiophilus]KYC48540.1 MAG: hypothetical protein APG11_00211 [Candidatus Methanofastidiosum methylthiophilus]KYC51290.1 MAG: hypothetical protein APG12_00215 [Candidatus Methanofastidiosum methylthiophilus]
MKKIEIESKGLTGFLRTFKQIVEDLNKEKEIKKIVFTGNNFTCTPFIELLTYVIRSMNKEIIYVPSINLDNPYKVILSSVDCDFISGGDPYSPDLLIIMGGLAMKGGPEVNSMKKFIEGIGNKDKKVIGICFMSVFEKAGWLNIIPFDYMIDIFLDSSIFGR